MSTYILLLVVFLFGQPLDVWEASKTHKDVCGPQGHFYYGVEADYYRTGIATVELGWADVDRKRYHPGEDCAVRWTSNLFGHTFASKVYFAIQDLKWKVGERWLYHKGLFFRLKRDEEMSPEVGSWHFGVYGYGLTG